MRLSELIGTCGNIWSSTYIEVKLNDHIRFAGHVKDMPYELRYYNVWYFEYIEKDKFEIVLC